MKKFFSLFAAVLFAGSMMAEVQNEDIILKTDAGFKAITITTAGASSTGADYEFSQGDITVAGTLGYVYNKKHTVYKNGTMIVSAGTNVIDSIQIEYNTSCYPFVELLAGGSTTTKTAAITKATFIPTEAATSCSFSNASAGKTEVREINVFYHASAPAPEEWDGTVILSKTTFKSVADLEGLQLTFNGATTVACLDEEADIIALQNEDGSEMYAVWAPGYGGTYTINGNVVTLNNWYDNTEAVALPTASTTLYFEDYGAFKVDGEAGFFETAEIAYEAPAATTYTVTYSVTGFDAEHCMIQAGYFDEEETVSGEFVAGANTVPENVLAYVSASVIDDYTVTLKVNGTETEMTGISTGVKMWYSDDVITADMTIEVIFKAPGGEQDEWASVYTTNVEFTAGTNSYLTDKIMIGENEYNAYKIGTSKASGNCSVTLPAGTESFHFHAICWSKTADTDLNITGAYEETVVIKAANISGNSPYTFDLTYADPTERYYKHEFEAPLKEAATVNFSCDYRAVFFGVNVDGKFTPTALQNTTAVKAVKVIENGNVVIIRDGVRYNIMGARF